ncbi:unnamed protein product [Brassica rapa subsp. trilocularis]
MAQRLFSSSHLSHSSASNRRHIYLMSRNGLLLLVALLLLLGVSLRWSASPLFICPNKSSSSSYSSLPSNWRDYSLAQAAKFVAKDGTVIVCTVSYPFLPFLSNWLISVSRQKHQDKVLVIAEDYATLYLINEKWPGHAVLIPPALDSQTAHKFGSKIKPLNQSHDLPPPDRNGVTYICSCMIFLRPTNGAKLLMKKWNKELQDGTKAYEGNDQPAFNWALNKTASQVDLYLLSQAAFPTGGLYFQNATWVEETKGKHVIIHNNYIIGYENKMKRFHDFGLWLVDDHAFESPLGKLE